MATKSGTLDAYSLTDIPPETYLTWTKFTFPDEHDGRMAIAVSEQDARIINALYTILITVIFAITWDILRSLIVFLYAPKDMTRTNYVTMITTWNSSDPLHAIPMLLKHSFKVLSEILRKDNVIESTWKSFGLDAVVLLLAFGGCGGSVAVGLKFPGLLVIGTAAPVNPASVFYPEFNTTSVNGSLANGQYSSRSAVRAIASVEGYEAKIEQHVNMTISDTINSSDEQRYEIYYSYNVSGLDMGLQHLSHLTLHVQGQCNFDDSWYNPTASRFYNETVGFDAGYWEAYTVWPKNGSNEFIGDFVRYGMTMSIPLSRRHPPFAKFLSPNYTITSRGNPDNQETGRSYYSIVPSTAMRISYTPSKDAWYATQSQSSKNLAAQYPYEIKLRRPPLKCWEDNDWSYKSWRGKMAHLISTGADGSRAPVRLPPAIEVILSTQLVLPVILDLGRANIGGALKSASRAVSPDSAIDAENSSAREDMKRLILAAFLATRDIFRTAAIAGTAAADPINSINILKTPGGDYLEGTGDFIVVSRAVVALDFTQMIVVPVVLVCLLLILCGLWLARKMTKPDGKPGRFRRFALYASGLQAAQLYRLLDQALAARGKYPIWSHETSWVPFVSSSSPKELPVPELRVATNNYGNASHIVMRPRGQPQDQIGQPPTSYPHDLEDATNRTPLVYSKASPKEGRITYTVELTAAQAGITDRRKPNYSPLTQHDY